MTAEMIEKFLDNNEGKSQAVNIHFKERNTITGIFIKGRDYEEMKAKNFWRIVNTNVVGEWDKTKDMSLSRLYNGLSFTKLS
ncbi:MAG: short-chain dehydrogenase [Sphingobacteriales bacterium]|nr:short-chain dehydrogenase [Sphingobacteriales bacterium]